MFLRPQLPETPNPNLPTTAQQVHAPACGCQHSAPVAPTPQRAFPSVGSGAVAAVVVGGVVVVALLAAVVVTAVSVAVAALVLRSLLGSRSGGIHHR
ncbi:SpdD protein [Streptomyces sp. NPDC006992]|uniref:SpdD protein n=1 Tax=Streptomyces sp. NPDC006992 TaxID=3155601 RepID=UPI0033F510B7